MAVVRFIYRGETLRNGRVCRLAVDDLTQPVAGAALLQALQQPEANVDLGRFAPFVYSKELEGWIALRPDDVAPLHRAEAAAVLRAEVMLELRQPAAAARGADDLTAEAAIASAASVAVASVAVASAGGGGATADRSVATSSDAGFFAVGVYNSKSAENVGTLWRGAFQLGAAYVFTIGTRNAWEKTADTYRSWRHIPAFRFEDWASFCGATPYSTVWVAVEMGGTPLEEFEHPERAVYVLGAEDQGLPASIVRACAHCVSLGSAREATSFNVAVAGSLVMYDRWQKRSSQRRAAASSTSRDGLQSSCVT